MIAYRHIVRSKNCQQLAVRSDAQAPRVKKKKEYFYRRYTTVPLSNVMVEESLPAFYPVW